MQPLLLVEMSSHHIQIIGQGLWLTDLNDASKESKHLSTYKKLNINMKEKSHNNLVLDTGNIKET